MENKLFISFLLSIAMLTSIGQPVKGVNYLAILKQASTYNLNATEKLPVFTYQSSNDSALIALRNKFNLDSVSGFGNQESRILNVLHWVHNMVKHDGQNASGITNINACEILTSSMTKKVGVSCGELATTLNDCFLALGYKTRKVYCFPKNNMGNDFDSHVINVVYLSTKNKWIWLDPTNDAYVMNERGELLSIEEVRQRLILNKPLIVNPDANWNRRSSVTKDYYLGIYMAKNLYRFYSPLHSEYNYESRGQNKTIEYVYLYPSDYKKSLPFKTGPELNSETKTSIIKYNIYNSRLFWRINDDE